MMFKKYLPGSVAPLALLFTLVSMSFTAAYLKNSFSQTAMEKYRYAEWKALYVAEAGLNNVGIIVLSKITADTLLLRDGVEYGKDEYGEPIGIYKDIACSTKLIKGSTENEYIAYARGVVEYTTPTGTQVEIKRRVYTTMIPEGLEKFMYFTHEEEPIGPGNTGVVNFGSSDVLEGKVHTNGTMVMSQYGCPSFSGEVSITFKAIENGGGVQYNNCDDVFEVDGVSILDTVPTENWPPSNSAEVTRQHATRIFQAGNKLFRTGKKDTLIMTEINFVEGGYYATQWWYNIPPVGSAPAEYDFIWDSTSIQMNCITSGTHFGVENNYDYTNDTYSATIQILSDFDANGEDVQEEILELVGAGDIIRIQNEDQTKVASYTATNNPMNFGDRILINLTNLVYSSTDGSGFDDLEPVTFINTSATTGLNEDTEWNSFYYYHDHLDDGVAYCEPGRIQHFDFEYWTAGGTGCDIFNCPDVIYNSEYVFMERVFFPKGNNPQVIYIKGGQVLVRGTVDGQYTIVTDDYTEYRRHDNTSIIDRVWGNIWLIDDVVYEDSYSNGATIHPEDGGSANVLGLIAGGSVIIANTRPNGARGQLYGSDITINAAILAMYGGFISHYWQNTLLGYHNPVNYTSSTGYTTVIADGRGGHRNYYKDDDDDGTYSNSNDYRGYVNLWGSIVQFKRGYMLRNYPGPYNVSPGVGYDKNYHYDWNLKIKPPPYYPKRQTEDGSVVLTMTSYGEVKNQDD